MRARYSSSTARAVTWGAGSAGTPTFAACRPYSHANRNIAASKVRIAANPITKRGGPHVAQSAGFLPRGQTTRADIVKTP